MKIGRKKILFILGTIGVIVLMVLDHIISALSLVAVLLFFIVILILNRHVYHSLFAPWEMSYLERNYDFLIIGDIEGRKDLVPKGKKVLKFVFPNRTLYASYVILQHVFSWLDENQGKVIILTDSKNLSNREISEYDIPLLHRITISKLSLKTQVTRYPLLKSPILSIKFLLNRKLPISYSRIESPLPELSEFCKKRNIQLTVMSH